MIRLFWQQYKLGICVLGLLMLAAFISSCAIEADANADTAALRAARVSGMHCAEHGLSPTVNPYDSHLGAMWLVSYIDALEKKNENSSSTGSTGDPGEAIRLGDLGRE